MRDKKWLDTALNELWDTHFSDIEKKNEIKIKFGRKSKKRLGSIILTKEKISLITLTSIFKDEFVPDYVVYETIAHELIHYIHGFSSTLEKKFKYPHQGGIIEIEMKKRGLFDVYKNSREWMNKNWFLYVNTAYKPKAKKKKVKVKSPSLRKLIIRKMVRYR